MRRTLAALNHRRRKRGARTEPLPQRFWMVLRKSSEPIGRRQGLGVWLVAQLLGEGPEGAAALVRHGAGLPSHGLQAGGL